MYLLQIFLINKTQHKDSWFSIYCMWLKVMHSVYRLLLSLYMWFPLLFILYPRTWCIVHLCFTFSVYLNCTCLSLCKVKSFSPCWSHWFWKCI